ncbi:two-component system LytT family response regulator [Dysgonomonas sp. PH5-45]|uniref:LytR/AlgR family response regulator transcription factor n=1 Tax=unclassified Dysgonomonas TaxID=2630389 RepID=UPI00247538DC|nr:MULTISPECIES: LytTR family DNA-binding domain-containing protein [unclassified Dysgonomonas]MDH6354452.1 two-component system LytT family response regulator [Dysgonomonas sp. PH5-45]MDH6387351.1 two-component system LytT family response regulator [Dysgonomonas sp. PH5-37]
MKLKCVIIDDEPLAIDLLKSYVNQTPTLDLVGAFENPLEATELLRTGGVNILFLDINMPQISGMEFSKTIDSNIKVIFTTAYDQYALEGFRLNALDYLLKPVSYSEFLQAVNKALEWFRLLETSESVAGSNNTSIFIKSGYRMEKLDFDNILYIENQKDYVKFHLEDEKEPVSSLMSMQSLEEKLPSSRFMRVHRSFIVNLDKIKTIERNCIVFGKEYIPVSDSYKERFMDFLNKYFF